ncbi:MAG: TetR/AcrR family transcriptional regulator [Chloroflexota bacterium]
MPYPTQITKDQIIQKAHALIEQEGRDALSLGKLATALGVKAPSLYRHVGSKAELVEEVNLYTLQRIFSTLEDRLAVDDNTSTDSVPTDSASTDSASTDSASTDSTAQILVVLQTLRQFAHAQPQTYLLMMTTLPGKGRPNEALLTEMILPYQALMARIVGEEQSLTALRGALALAHGFILLELNQQLQRGGDLAADFNSAVHAYLAGWSLTK